MHKIEIYNDGKSILKKPVFIEACDPNRIKVVNIQDGVIGREQQFKSIKINTNLRNIIIILSKS
jgi:hypothetical protein